MPRRSGILLPVASLPSNYGIGDFGPTAFSFLDWLTAAGQRAWEVLPLLLTDGGGSPFSPPSSFAMNWLLVSPKQLMRDGWIIQRELDDARQSSKRISYPQIIRSKRHIIGRAWQRFRSSGSLAERRRFDRFRTAERWWLDDYCLFMAIKDVHHGKPWWTWPVPLRDRNPRALVGWRRQQATGLDYYAFGQWLAREQWNAVRRYASQNGIRIIGDLPYGVTHDSVDVWANRHFFRVRRDGAMTAVSGAPPDVFYKNGQVWGNPLYNWRALQRIRFAWWTKRLRTALDWYDEVRLDHFRGFHAVWSIPARRPNARRGHWERVPGEKLFREVERIVPFSRIIAEDLGKLTPAVHRLRDAFAFPGMRIVQFGFRKPLAKLHHPAVYPKNSICYTGTHDMPPLRMWRSQLSDEERAALRKTFGTIPAVRELVRTALHAKSDTALIPIADLLELGPDARINTPGIVSRRNWTWRLDTLPPQSLAKWLRKETRKAGR
ncbi:MAG: 4-alpha-glucanotransferase [Candidatus Kerfeldbacteria bacterium]|nr:4-alpha-glucanotransferase [Candidatus Kerfeldbacteria bacterium]